MDLPCTYAEFHACLRDLGQINTVTFGYRPTLTFLGRLPKQDHPLHILDIGCGGGEMLRRIRHWAKRRQLKVELTGIDLNPHAERFARVSAQPGENIRFLTADVFSFKPDHPVDVAISCLFAHHLANQELVRFLQWMERTTARGWFINDLHRESSPYHLFRLVAKLAGWHRFVQHDGPLSILRSFQPSDWRHLSSRAGLSPSQVTVETFRPGRLCVGRIK